MHGQQNVKFYVASFHMSFFGSINLVSSPLNVVNVLFFFFLLLVCDDVYVYVVVVVAAAAAAAAASGFVVVLAVLTM